MLIHRVRVGRAGSELKTVDVGNLPMPSAVVSGWSMQQVVDVLTYAQDLPVNPPPPPTQRPRACGHAHADAEEELPVSSS